MNILTNRSLLYLLITLFCSLFSQVLANELFNSCDPSKNLKDNEKGVKVLTQNMFSEANTCYDIRHDYYLGEDIILKEGCTLRFKGGSIRNQDGCSFRLTGNKTKLKGNLKGIFNRIRFQGTWNVNRVSTDMLINLSYDNALVDLFSLNNDEQQTVIEVKPGTYYIDVKSTTPIQSGLIFKSNTEVILNGDIHLRKSDFNYYGIIDLLKVKNVYIHGSGTIVGDLDYTKARGGGGHGIRIRQSSDVRVEGLTLIKCIGDGIYVDGRRNISISNCVIRDCRRQGVSVTNANSCLIERCDISSISGDSIASWAIDIEPNSDNICDSIIIRNCSIHDTGKGQCCTYSTGKNAKVMNVLIEKNTINSNHKGLFIDGGLGPVYVNDNTIRGYDRIEYPNGIDEQPYWCIENKGKSFFKNNTIDGGILNSYEATYEGNTITSHFNSLQKVKCRKNLFVMTAGKRDNDLIQLSGDFSDNIIKVKRSSYRVGNIFDVRGKSTIQGNTIYDASYDKALYGSVYGMVRESVQGYSKIQNNTHSATFHSIKEKSYIKLISR